MRRKTIIMLVACAAIALILIGCAGKSDWDETRSDMPDWILNPNIEGGIAASECARWSGDFSMDKAEATALARATLAKQIDVQVQAMDKTYKRKVGTEKGQSTGSVFESVSKQLTQKHLKGAHVKRVDKISIDGEKQLCVMCVLDPQATEKLFQDIVEQSETKLDPREERVLYEEFRSEKAQEELDKELEEMD